MTAITASSVASGALISKEEYGFDLGGMRIIEPELAAADTFEDDGLEYKYRGVEGEIPDSGYVPVGNDGLSYRDFYSLAKPNLMTGVRTWYQDGVRIRKNYPVQHFVYRVFDKVAGEWSEARIIRCEESAVSCSPDAAQMIHFSGGNMFVPVTLHLSHKSENRHVKVLQMHFNGRDLTLVKGGNLMTLEHKRGFLEPSMAIMNGRYVLTIRAENGRMFKALSRDGLYYSKPTPWEFDTGEQIKTSTTQQHFYRDALNGKDYLLYVRNDGSNDSVIRYRDKIFMSEIDDEFNLVRSTERVVIGKYESYLWASSFRVVGDTVFSVGVDPVSFKSIYAKASLI